MDGEQGENFTARRRVLVTGAARGLGLAIVNVLAGQGFEAWGADVLPRPDTVDPDRWLELDVTDPLAVNDALGHLQAAGGLYGLVNNAAIFPLTAWDEVTLDEWTRTLEVNLTGPFLMCQGAGRMMRDQNAGGAIVNVTSLTFFKGIASGLGYSASKGGVVGLTRSLARALGPYGIRVNAVAPGLMATEGVLEQVDQGKFPKSRMGESDDDRQLPGRTETAGVAESIAFLLGDGSREITGQVMAVDGGSIFLG
jgi:NAD(P)-dependent dehydrogenase (short-subunit alcohol dehydrogenase family)